MQKVLSTYISHLAAIVTELRARRRWRLRQIAMLLVGSALVLTKAYDGLLVFSTPHFDTEMTTYGFMAGVVDALRIWFTHCFSEPV